MKILAKAEILHELDSDLQRRYSTLSFDVSIATLKQVSRLYLESFKAVFYTLAALGGLGLVSLMFLDEIELKRKELGDQGFGDK